MNTKFKLMLLFVTSVLLLSGCENITFQFFDEFAGPGERENPDLTSTCAYWEAQFGLPEFLCVECTSDGADKASKAYCGAEISARCNSDDETVFGVAFGVHSGGFSPMTSTAWTDNDLIEGASENDLVICHEQSMDWLGKQQHKCTTELKGNGKDGGMTFEAEFTYDPLKDDCDPP